MVVGDNNAIHTVDFCIINLCVCLYLPVCIMMIDDVCCCVAVQCCIISKVWELLPY